MARLRYFYLSDTLFEIGRDGSTPLRNALTQAAITSPAGAVSVQLVNKETNVNIGSPFDLVHQGSPDGWWLYDIPHDFASGALTNNLHVIAQITIVSGTLNAYWAPEGVVETQKGDSVS